MCSTPTLRDAQIEQAFLTALAEITEGVSVEGLRDELATVFDTSDLESEREELRTRVAELEAAFAGMVARNQQAALDQDDYAKQATRIEAEHHVSTARLAEIDRLIAEAATKHTALLGAFDELATQPVQVFTRTQWTALIDHATVGVEEIAFTFRDGRDITVQL